MSYKHICNNIGQATLILSTFLKKNPIQIISAYAIKIQKY